MGREFHNNAGRLHDFDYDKHLNEEASFQHEVSGGPIGFNHVNWNAVVSCLNYFAQAHAGRQWSNMSRQEKDMWNEVRRAERAARNRYDRRAESINALSRQHQEKGCNVILAWDRAIESRQALDYDRFSQLAKKYASFVDCVSLQAINKRIRKDANKLHHFEHVFIEDGRKAGIFMEHPMRYGSMADSLIEGWVEQTWPLEPLESIVKSRRSDDLRRYWLAYHTDDYFEQGNLWPAHCIMGPEEEQRMAEIAKILEAAGVEIGPEGHGQVWGN